jgi:hypothetical protein
VLGALGAAVLGAAGLLLLTGGSDATDAPLVPAAAVAATPQPPATSPASAAANPSAPAVAGAGHQPGRDPFQGLHSVRSAIAPTDVDVQPTARTGSGAAPAVVPQPAAPVSSASSAPAEGTLELQAVEVAGEQRTAVFALDGTTLRAQVGASFGPDAALLLLSLQQERGGVQWTALVQVAGGDPFDVTTGAHVHLP